MTRQVMNIKNVGYKSGMVRGVKQAVSFSTNFHDYKIQKIVCYTIKMINKDK